MISWQEDIAAAGWSGTPEAFASIVTDSLFDIATEWPTEELFTRPQNIRFYPEHGTRMCNLVRHRAGVHNSLPSHAIMRALLSVHPCRPDDADLGDDEKRLEDYL